MSKPAKTWLTARLLQYKLPADGITNGRQRGRKLRGGESLDIFAESPREMRDGGQALFLCKLVSLSCRPGRRSGDAGARRIHGEQSRSKPSVTDNPGQGTIEPVLSRYRVACLGRSVGGAGGAEELSLSPGTLGDGRAAGRRHSGGGTRLT